MSLTNLISEIKQNARLILQKRYWILVLIFLLFTMFGITDHMKIYSLIFSFISIVFNLTFRIGIIMADSRNDLSEIIDALKDFDFDTWVAGGGKESLNYDPDRVSQVMSVIGAMLFVFLFMLVIIAFVALFAFVLKTFLTNPILVGKNRYLLKLEQGKEDFSDLFFTFNSKDNYLNTVKVMLLRDIFVWLWSLLFIIPGVIKDLSYFMVPYIISENPDMPYKRAFDISKTVMNGEKWNLFVIYLSFLGWMILGTYCTCGLGFYFVLPYLETTMMEYYIYLKNKALKMNIINENELEYRPFHYNNAAFQNG